MYVPCVAKERNLIAKLSRRSSHNALAPSGVTHTFLGHGSFPKHGELISRHSEYVECVPHCGRSEWFLGSQELVSFVKV